MDVLEGDILTELSKKKESILKLSKKLGVPASTLHNRIKKLEERGVIKKYKAEIDWKKIGYRVEAYILIYVDTMRLKKLRKDQLKIKEELKGFYFVEECRIITGDADLILKIRAKDNKELGYLLTNYIQGVDGIIKTKTLVCID